MLQKNEKNSEAVSSLALGMPDTLMVGWMRLALAVAVLLTILIDPEGIVGIDHLTPILLSAYMAHCILLCVTSYLGHPIAESKMIHWVDISWYAVIVFSTGSNASIFFLFFFFSIFTASFRWGFEEGARVTLVSSLVLIACSVISDTGQNLPRLLLRVSLLLTLGYMSAYWGETKIGLKRRLELLQDVSRLSNPRFGVDHTTTSVLEKTRDFYRGSNCILVMRDRDTGKCTLRMVNKSAAKQSISAQQINNEGAAPLLMSEEKTIVMYSRIRWLQPLVPDESIVYDIENAEWRKHDRVRDVRLAELLESDAFISAPVSLRKAEGRIYVTSQASGFSRSDALFLSHIAAQAFPVIESIELLDRMVSEAASQERQKIALNLHDTAIQPYIGLKLGLSAVRNRASADNPLLGELDKLTAMASQVIDDLRSFAGNIKNSESPSEPIFLFMLRRQLAQLKEFYGIDMKVNVEGTLNISDRLTAEVLHVVREGLSNICRHTTAQRGFIRLQCTHGSLRIQIENEGVTPNMTPFIPRSITERASNMGGGAWVRLSVDGNTTVHVEIPV